MCVNPLLIVTGVRALSTFKNLFFTPTRLEEVDEGVLELQFWTCTGRLGNLPTGELARTARVECFFSAEARSYLAYREGGVFRFYTAVLNGPHIKLLVLTACCGGRRAHHY